MRSATSRRSSRPGTRRIRSQADDASYYGGFKQQDVKPTPDSPLLKLGIEKIPPLVTTTVLLDAKRHVGKGKAMADGEVVTAAHIEAMLKAQGLGRRGILPGDMVWIYTGWSENWKEGDAASPYYAMAPGLAVDAAKWLAARRVVAVGLDAPFIDAVPNGMLQGKAQPAGRHRTGPAVLDPPLPAVGVRHPPSGEPEPRRDGRRSGVDLRVRWSCRRATRVPRARSCGRSRSVCRVSADGAAG
jgi:hypothetical protein